MKKHFAQIPSDGTISSCCRQSNIDGATNNYAFLDKVRLQWFKFEKRSMRTFISWQDSWLAFASTKPQII